MALVPIGNRTFNREGRQILRNLDRLDIYPHQKAAVRAVIRQLEGEREEGQKKIALVVLPTGTGKTGVAVLAAYCLQPERVLIITPSRDISIQLYTQFTYVSNEGLNPMKSKPFLIERGVFSKEDQDKIFPVADIECASVTKKVKSAICEGKELIITNAHKFGEDDRGVNLQEIESNYFSLVIVDEAHHYPARTWEKIVDHFFNAKILFLTATPYNKGNYILSQLSDGEKRPVYQLSLKDAIDDGIIRDVVFEEAVENEQDCDRKHIEEDDQVPREGQDDSWFSRVLAVLRRMHLQLKAHDDIDQKTNVHNGIIVANSISDARLIKYLWNKQHSDFGLCETFVQSDSREGVEQFLNPKENIRVLVVIYRLTEGFDCKNISVIAILRTIGKRSRVYFTQIVGRAVRKLHQHDPVKATIISHKAHKQQANYDQFRALDGANKDPAIGLPNDDPQDEPENEV